MSEELDILRIVADNPSISQRKIAEKAGISLGQVNLLIKKCTKKGLIKIEGQTTKSLKYNLTPKGISEKAALTFEYIKISFDAITALSNSIGTLGMQYQSLGKKIFVCGSNDEMMQIIRLALNSNQICWSLWKHGEQQTINKNIADLDYVVLTWEPKLKEELEKEKIYVINVLE